MDRTERKARVADWKERKVVAGIYALRCTPADAGEAGGAWVGRAPDIGSIQTRLWFSLKHGSSPHRALQAAWKAHGEAAFRFEVLESLEPDESGPVAEYLLRARHEHWLEKLGASKI
jgi:hypothetical protein